MGVLALGEAQAQEAVLLPSAGPALERAFANTSGAWVLENARISPHNVAGRACQPSGVCLSFSLVQSSTTCPGTVIPAGCATVAPPDSASTPGLLAVLRTVPSAWKALEPTAPPPRRPLLPSVVVWCLAPIVFSAGLAWLVRRRRARFDSSALGRGSRHTVLLGAAMWILAGGVLSLVGSFWLLWDGLAMGALAAAVWWILLWPVPVRGLVVGAVASLLALCGAEAGLRWTGLSQAPIAPPASVPWRLQGGMAEEAATQEPGLCALWGPPLGDEHACPPVVLPPTGGDVILHVGDSMLQGAGLERSQNLTAWLEKLDPATSQINTGLASTSLDLQAAIARRWIDVVRPQALVLHVFAGNDLLEVGAPRLYCNDASVLVSDSGGVRERCERPVHTASNWKLLLRHSPPPFALRWLAQRSEVARAIARGFVAIGNHQAAVKAPSTAQSRTLMREDAEARYKESLDYLLSMTAARQIPVVAVMMPGRGSLFGPYFDDAAGTLRQVLQKADVPVLESQTLFDQVTRTEGEAAVFLDDPPGDPHLNAHGLELLGRWLSPQLVAWRTQGHLGAVSSVATAP